MASMNPCCYSDLAADHVAGEERRSPMAEELMCDDCGENPAGFTLEDEDDESGDSDKHLCRDCMANA